MNSPGAIAMTTRPSFLTMTAFVAAAAALFAAAVLPMINVASQVIA
jgi:hypothetical protein